MGTVIGHGRVYFHSGPDASCKTQKLFIVPGDPVAIYAERGAYSLISYSAENDDYSAWVLSERLQILAKPDAAPPSR